MIRFDSMTGFAPNVRGVLPVKTLGARTPQPTVRAAVAPPAPAPVRMAQAVAVSPEMAEARARLDEAQTQLVNLEKNFDSVVASFGAADAGTALVEAKRSVEMYQQAYGTQL